MQRAAQWRAGGAVASARANLGGVEGGIWEQQCVCLLAERRVECGRNLW